MAVTVQLGPLNLIRNPIRFVLCCRPGAYASSGVVDTAWLDPAIHLYLPIQWLAPGSNKLNPLFYGDDGKHLLALLQSQHYRS